MRLEQVRAAKERIRSDTAHTFNGLAQAEGTVLEDVLMDPERPRGLAVGIGLTENAEDYRLAVRVPDERAESWFRTKYKGLIDEYGKENIDVKIVRKVAVPSSAGSESILAGSAAPPRRSGKIPLAIGSTVRHMEGSRGTLGFFAKRDGKWGLVSCNHVIARRDEAKLGEGVVHAETEDVVAHLANIHPLSGGRAKADCAYAQLCDPMMAPKAPGLVNGQMLVRGTPELKEYLPVVKVGASTNVTTGRIAAYELDDFEVDYVGFFTYFDDVIEIESTEQNAETGRAEGFGDDGDSGALIYGEKDRQPIGLLFYKTTGGPDNSGLIYANPIGEVEKALGVEIAI